MSIANETCFVIGNGESRNIFGNLHALKNKGTIYGCNAIYRDYPDLCDKIFLLLGCPKQKYHLRPCPATVPRWCGCRNHTNIKSPHSENLDEHGDPAPNLSSLQRYVDHNTELQPITAGVSVSTATGLVFGELCDNFPALAQMI